jgi:proton-coupled amino acid transporter
MTGGGVPDDVTPLLGHTGRGTASELRTAGNIFISIVGAGVLGLPYVFKTSGWAVAVTTVTLAASLTYYCMLLLVMCKDKALAKGMRCYTYGDLGQEAYGAAGRQLVDVLICISQIGCCIAYLIFLGTNLSSIFTGATKQSSFFIFMLIPFEMCIACVRSLAALAPFSIFADICNMAALALVVREDFRNFKGFGDLNSFTTVPTIAFAMGIGIYCFEGFGMTITLEASMQKPKKFGKILALMLSLITLVYVAFGFVGYLAFREETRDIITLNLPASWTTVLVKAGLIIALFFTFPVMMYPVHEIVDHKLLTSTWFQKIVMPSPHLHVLLANAVRGITVLAVAIVAVSVPGFGIFISLVGGTVCALLAFVLPSLFHMHLCWDTAHWTTRIFDIVLIVCGVLFAIYSTYTTVAQLFFHAS